MNLNSSLEISSQLSSIKKSNTSLADALREIELAKQSFEKVAFLENTLNYHQLTLDDLKSQASRFVTTGFFNSKWDSLINILDQIVKTKFEEFTNQFHNSLNQKLNIAQADVMLKQKVNCMDFTALSQQMTVLKTQVDKHIYTDFESMKTKFKMTLAQLTNVNPSQIFSEVTKDDLEKINRKIEILEKSIKNTNYEEEGLDEDIDSQAELDSMIDGLERAILDEYKGST